MRWKVPMPKQAPAAGQAHVVIAIKGAHTRLEFQAQMPEDKAQEVIETLMEQAAKKAKS